MRTILLLPLLLLGACDVDTDSANDQVKVEFDREPIDDAANTAGAIAAGAGNVVESAGEAVANEVRDIDVDVDVDVNRNRANDAEKK